MRNGKSWIGDPLDGKLCALACARVLKKRFPELDGVPVSSNGMQLFAPLPKIGHPKSMSGMCPKDNMEAGDVHGSVPPHADGVPLSSQGPINTLFDDLYGSAELGVIGALSPSMNCPRSLMI